MKNIIRNRKKATINHNFKQIELARIISMALIVTAHAVDHSNFTWWDYTLKGKFLVSLLYVGRASVPIFSMISGFYMAHYKLSIRKLFRLEKTIWFYGAIGFFINFIITKKTTTFNILRVIFPITLKTYWFATAFFLMSFFAPILVKLYKRIKPKFLLIGVIATSIIYFILMQYCFNAIIDNFKILPIINTGNGSQPINLNELFITYFFYIVEFSIYRTIGYLINEYFEKLKSYKKNIIILFIIWGLIYSVIIPLIFDKRYSINTNIIMLSNHAYPTSLLFSALLFIIIIFSKPIKKDLRKISSLMFSVYLLHMNPWTSKYIWIDIFHSNYSYNHFPLILFIVYIFIEIILVFCVSSLIVYLQKKLLPNI